MTYAIHEPVTELPPVAFSNGTRHGWDLAYLAARRAKGLWVPVAFPDRADARRLAEVARKRTQQDFEAEVRGNVVYLRVKITTTIRLATTPTAVVATFAGGRDQLSHDGDRK